MANSDRSRIEVLRRRAYPTTSNDVIHIGDLLVENATHQARPASSVTGGSAAAVKAAVAAAFIGVAIHAKAADKQPVITVGADLVAEMDCAASGAALPSGVAGIGANVEIDTDDDGAGTITAANQRVTFGDTSPIGKVAYPKKETDVTVTCHFLGIEIKQ